MHFISMPWAGRCGSKHQLLLCSCLLPKPPALAHSDKAPWLLHAYAKQLGSVFRLRLAHWHLVVVSDPAEALRLLSR